MTTWSLTPVPARNESDVCPTCGGDLSTKHSTPCPRGEGVTMWAIVETFEFDDENESP